MKGKTIIRNGCKEWYCKHGIGHYVEIVEKGGNLTHGCDGCCAEYELDLTKPIDKIISKKSKVNEGQKGKWYKV